MGDDVPFIVSSYKKEPDFEIENPNDLKRRAI